jgi:putative hydrolase of the HAD superfamily
LVNTPSLPQAILFDMDDTLLTDTANASQCWQAALDHFADRLALTETSQALAAIQEHGRWYWGDLERHRLGRLDIHTARREIVAEVLARMGIADHTLAHEIADLCSHLREEAIAFCDGASDALCHLRQRGVKLALLTNGGAPMQRRKIERFGLAAHFDCILIEGEFGAGKPDERVYRHALAQLGARPADAWMVGDHLEWEVAAPQRLGIFSIWVDQAGNGLPISSATRPDRIIRAVRELLT